MENTEEPQKKIFKARKTMRASDRQQLEAVYKVKEGLLKTSDVKLLNGKHENGDSDINSPLNDTDCMEDKAELNGIDVCLELEEKKEDFIEIPGSADISTDSQNCDQDRDLNPSLELLSLENVICEQEQEIATSTEADNQVFDISNNDSQVENVIENKIMDQRKTEVLLGSKIREDFLEDKMELNASSNLPPSEFHNLDLHSDFHLEEELQELEEEKMVEEEGEKMVEVNDKVKGLMEEGQGREEKGVDNEMQKEDEIGVLIEMEKEEEKGIVKEKQMDEGQIKEESEKEERQEKEGSMLEKEEKEEKEIVKEEEKLKVINVEKEERDVAEEIKDEEVREEKKEEREEEILKVVGLTKEEEKLGIAQEMEKEKGTLGILEAMEEKGEKREEMKEEDEQEMLKETQEEKKEKLEVVEEISLDADIGEEAISSSMEIDQDPKDEEEKSIDFPETSADKSPVNLLSGCSLESPDSMETDEIIPILEKLAPVGDELNSFPKVSLLSGDEVSRELENKIENSLGSPSKQEGVESLPTEAFLVLSDEEEPCAVEEDAEVLVPKESNSQEDKVFEDMAKEEEILKEGQKEEEKHPEKGEISRRKRSKSEDMDSVQSKRRRYEGEEFEAELKVKITSRGDINQKLEKVIQKLLEEKLSALQCAVFDKTLADLKTRVEKIECKKHENVLNGIQAKIARLSKRFGAAKEDLKKRQETPANPPASPGKPVSDANANSNLTYRNASTVRQMLESKRNVGEATTSFQAPTSTGLPPPNQPIQRLPSTSQPSAVQTPTRAAPDWKLIRQRIPAASIAAPQTILSGQPKPPTPVTSASVMTSVLPAPTTATVVGTSQVPSGSAQPMSVSLQSLPVILHVPVAVSSQSQLLQGTTGTLVTNQQSGSVEFIPVQSQPAVGNLTKTPVSLASANTVKPNNSPAVSSPGMQRNSPASSSLSTTLAVQAVTTAHSVAQAARTSLPTVTTSGPYNPPPSRGPIQMKIPISAFNNPSPTEPPAAPRIEIQNNRTPTTADSTANKRIAENSTQGAKAAGGDSSGVIDLTLDDEDDGSSQGRTDSRKTTQISASGSNQSTQVLSRPLQPPQTTLPPAVVPTGLPSQTTIHVLPTAQTTVNVTHRPITQTTTRVPISRAPTSQQLVYTTLATPANQTVRNGVMQNQGVRQVNPQAGGVTVRVPQTTAYVVNNGLAIGSGGPQLTVHHRPPQEPARPLHPAPLPEAPQPQRLPSEAAGTSLPQKPHLKLARVQSQNGIVLSWSVLEVDRSCAAVDSYHLYAYHEDPTAITPSQWKKIGEVKALPLPMACTLTQFVSGSKYYFAVRAKDIYGRFGSFCDPQSTDVISQSS
ncbi:activating transcription factor 7-interacting protein 1 [Rhinatrema bivittatum]|uniref:activating transcription factor 7-interacting protein 1 n=1 Tax=Rhinatrema bivittatum TaxID=194408 RepID=UPI001127F2AC|nr:activating transcription factor 7-interacting protein 1 [Rhinatrema bivittatum]XP_029446201.1 activating transcription factor 7-interacting protein 1 [Rhinatrema bivittatum]XP_029446202.1 activating transcription factor 7-interacting protein 1 [Rhinatrema bivittatum]XP_029446203.1 activating transcription factor 7-interacting protein 1 [Rhinatrema bivittatum]XP_029446204.1 activating transcription factor 7-interacting protein 1 [Rhinatrema bivittatum]